MNYLDPRGKPKSESKTARQMPPDWELLERWQQGDSDAGTKLMKRYLGLLTRFFNNKVSDQQDVGDLVAETLLACTRGMMKIRNSKSFRSYLFATAFNQLRRHYQRQTKRSLEREDFEQCCVADLGQFPVHSHGMEPEEQAHLMVHALRSLPLTYQIVLELSLFEGMRGRQIGELLDLPTATVHTRLRRGRDRLAEAVAHLQANPDRWGVTVTQLEDWARQLHKQVDSNS